MTVLDENPHDGNFILSEDDEGRLSRDNIIIASGAGQLRPGTVLGKLTAGGKFVPSPETRSIAMASSTTRPSMTTPRNLASGTNCVRPASSSAEGRTVEQDRTDNGTHSRRVQQ
jgi:hypothetical protein